MPTRVVVKELTRMFQNQAYNQSLPYFIKGKYLTRINRDETPNIFYSE